MNNLDERALLGAILLDGTQLDGLTVEPEDFYEPKHETIYRVLKEMRTALEPIDPITVNAKLPKGFDPGYIYELMTDAPTAAVAPHYAKIVLDNATNRRLKILAETMTSQRLSPEDVEIKVKEILARKSSGKQVVYGVRDLWLEQADFINAPPNFTPTGIEPLDKLIDGWRPGALYIIAARPGVGKTLAGLQFALAAAKHAETMFVSIEMSRKELLHRVIAQTATIPLSRLIRHELTDSDWTRFAQARDKVDNLNILDTGSVTLSTLQHQLAQHPETKFLFVDYLGIMQGEGGSQYEKITQISNGLKQLARNFDIPVIALHQLNRGVESRSTNVPVMADLRDSGAIEQDGDVVILLHREDLDSLEFSSIPAEARKDNLMKMAVAKNRHGQTGTVGLRVIGTYQRLERL